MGLAALYDIAKPIWVSGELQNSPLELLNQIIKQIYIIRIGPSL